MKVKDAAKSLLQLLKDGHGDLDLIARDTRSGCTSSVTIYDNVSHIDSEDNEDCGTLCDKEIDYEYVSVYLNH